MIGLRSVWFLFVALFIAGVLACGENAPQTPQSSAAASAETPDSEIAKFTKFIEARPTQMHLRITRAKAYREKGDAESLRKAIADYDTALKDPSFSHINIQIAYLLDRGTTRGQLYKLNKEESVKTASLEDFTSAIKLETRSTSYESRGLALLQYFDEPFLAEQDLVVAVRVIDWRSADPTSTEARLYVSLVKAYQAIAPRVKGLPEEAQYTKLLDAATAKKRGFESDDRRRAAVREEMLRRNAAETLAMIEKRDAANAPQERDKAQAQYNTANAATPHRAVCRACGGRGYQSAGGGTEFRIDWIPTARGSEMRSTHTTKPPTVLTCPECWGSGYLTD